MLSSNSGGSYGGGGGGGVHPDPEIRGWPGLKKKFFRPFGPQFGLKIRGGHGPPGPSPGSPTGYSVNIALFSLSPPHLSFLRGHPSHIRWQKKSS